jgi:hypothetical protein
MPLPVYEGSSHPVVPQADPSKVPSIKKEDTFIVDGFEFDGPKSDVENRITVASMMNMLMIALASSGDQNIRKVLKQAGITIEDKQGKVYFPRIGD